MFTAYTHVNAMSHDQTNSLCTHSCTTVYAAPLARSWFWLAGEICEYFGEIIIYFADEDWFVVYVRRDHKNHVKCASYGKI